MTSLIGKSTKSSISSMVVRDRISKFPDELLVLILSRLSIKKAARTSILSHKWEKLWIRYQGNLKFDVTNKLHRYDKNKWTQIMYDHIDLMKQVSRSLLFGCSMSPLNSLTIRALYPNVEKYQMLLIDILVEFLMDKKIRILDFDIYTPSPVAGPFSFPVGFYAWIKQPHGLHAISAFTSLSFRNVSISDDTVEYFLSNCPLLERLCVQLSHDLANLRIIGDASLKLKHLKIKGSKGMESLVVSAPNLVSLDYECYYETKLDVSNVPKLVEVCIGEHVMTYMSGSLSTYLSQIRTLKLIFYAANMAYTKFTLSRNVALFSDLQNLILSVVITEDDESFLEFTSSLVEASPILEKVTLETVTCVSTDSEVGLQKMMTRTPSRKQYSHQSLKVVEFTSFYGVAPEVELLVYFVENFSSLEKIIIDTSTTTFTIETQLGLQLMKHIPLGLDLVLIKQ